MPATARAPNSELVVSRRRRPPSAERCEAEHQRQGSGGPRRTATETKDCGQARRARLELEFGKRAQSKNE
eukprot:4061603-Pyramimonas_sp.AAC.1